MPRVAVCVLIFVAITPLHAQEAAMVGVDAGPLRLVLDTAGRVSNLSLPGQKTELLSGGQSCPLLTLTIGGKAVVPTAAHYGAAGKLVTLTYPGGATATVRVATKPTHLTLELLSVEGAASSRVDWGPFPLTIGKTVGETIGVVRDDRIAIGIQGLNIQTIGGAAKAEPAGSKLFAYAVEHDGGVKGAKIALFGCVADGRDIAATALAAIGEIEVAEGLPHPMLDGQWGKVSSTAHESYLIAPFGESNLDAVVQQARKAGLRYVYHPGPFATWGHFQLNPLEFPGGDESMKRCVERAAKQGVRLGVHTLTGFITTNDPYVSPVPDPRLARTGSSTLAAGVDSTATEIPVADAELLKSNAPWSKPMNTVIIGAELVQFGAISEKAPWLLLDCKRGAFGTTASAHAAGAEIGRLADHAYNTFYPGIDNGMMDEMTARLADLVRRTGLRQLSFDGLEGLSAYGYGEYSRNRFVKQCYDAWHQEVISDASNLLHYLWHIHTRMNWGEPWGKAMREGMAEYRFANQDYFDRNLLPRMLGWWELRTASGSPGGANDLEATSLEDVEWMLAKSAGYDAGFAISTSLPVLKANAESPAILGAVRTWETARQAGAFTPEQRERLRDPRGEFHLESAGEGRWRLYPVEILAARGAGVSPAFSITNRFAAQPLRFVLRAVAGKPSDRRGTAYDPTRPDAAGKRRGVDGVGAAGAVSDPRFAVNGVPVSFGVALTPGQYLVCDGEPVAFVYDANWNLVGSVRAAGAVPSLPQGTSTVEIAYEAAGDPPLRAQVSVKLIGAPAALRSGGKPQDFRTEAPPR